MNRNQDAPGIVGHLAKRIDRVRLTFQNGTSVETSARRSCSTAAPRTKEVNMKFYDVREAMTIFSSHKTLYQACLVQQQAPRERRVVLASLSGTKWRDLRGYSTAECRKVVRDGPARRRRSLHQVRSI